MPSGRRDVSILHSIIVTAQNNADVTTHRFRAIFSAYDEVLAEHGIDPNHDQIYLRFLFRLGDAGRRDQPLFEAFLALLKEFDIELVLNEEEAEETRHLGSGNGVQAKEATISASPLSPPRRSRRASFSSFHNVEDETTGVSPRRSSSRASLSRPNGDAKILPIEYPSTRATTGLTERHEAWKSRRVENTPQTARGRLTAKEFGSNLQRVQRRNASSSSQGTNVYHRNMNRAVLKDKRHLTGGHVLDSAGLPNHFSNRRIEDSPETQVTVESTDAHLPRPEEFMYRPSETQLLRDADVFEGFRIRSVAREVLPKWNVMAVKAREQHAEMDQRALNHDLGVLLRQAWDQWHGNLMERRHAAQTKRYLQSQERKATSHYENSILRRSFIHWVACASEELQRTAVAHRYILRLRYFKAWYEITTVTNMKIRSQRVKKFLLLWKQASNFVRIEETRAMDLHHGNLVEMIYWRWFWNFCANRAPEWRNARLRNKYLLHWHAASQLRYRQYQQAADYRTNILRTPTFIKWYGKVQIVLSSGPSAQQFRRQKLVAQCLPQWQQQLRFIPLTRQISGMVDWRIAYTAFSKIVTQFRLTQQAEKVSRQRILRNAWTAWNDRLRCQALSREINERLILQALYKWVLAERFRLLRRLNEERLMRRTLLRIVARRRQLTDRHRASFEAVVSTGDRRLLLLIMQPWHERMQLQSHRERQAFEFCAPHLVEETFNAWVTEHRQSRQLYNRAREAAFYFRASRTFKRWQAAVLESRKCKRRDAYILVRRQVKMKLARNVLIKWREMTLNVKQSERDAEEVDQRRVLFLGVTLFDRWKNRLQTAQERMLITENRLDRGLAQKYFKTWLQQFTTWEQNEEHSRLFDGLHVSKLAYNSLRAFQLKVFELRSQTEKANSFIQSNEKRFYHNLLRSWHHKALQTRGTRDQDVIAQTTRSSRPAWRPGPEGTTGIIGRAEEWTAFDDDLGLGEWIPGTEAQASSTPLPGYLSTPSKRAARAKAMARGPNTPAAPLATSTPLQPGSRSVFRPITAPSSARRVAFGRSFGQGRIIEDIPEGSPSTPGPR